MPEKKLTPEQMEQRRKYARRWYQEHRERILEYHRCHYQEHREKIRQERKQPAERERRREWKRRHYETHRDQELEATRRDYQKHQEERKQKQREYYEEKRANVLAYGRQYYQKDRAKWIARVKKWRKTNREASRMSRRVDQSIIRAKKHQVTGRFKVKDIKELSRLQHEKCAICQEAFPPAGTPNRYHVDHILSMSGGGLNTRDNIQLLCPSCNRRKQ